MILLTKLRERFLKKTPFQLMRPKSQTNIKLTPYSKTLRKMENGNCPSGGTKQMNIFKFGWGLQQQANSKSYGERSIIIYKMESAYAIAGAVVLVIVTSLYFCAKHMKQKQ